MVVASSFREQLEAVVAERHCADHPMTEKWARGELSRGGMMGWGIEQYHWIKRMPTAVFHTCAEAPADVRAAELENFHEETDEARPHLEIILRFARANGANLDEVRAGRGLPTTEAWTNWLLQVSREQHWIAAIAAVRVGTESQSPRLYSKLTPALRDIYTFAEEDYEHFWLHSEVDIEHGDRGFQLLERHCTTPELRDLALHYAGESARLRWFYFDGIYLHYEMGYRLA